jgi:hypothetical protein
MTIREKQAASGRWLDVSEWIDRLYWVVHYSSWYKPDISAIHVHILFYNYLILVYLNVRFCTSTTSGSHGLSTQL